MSVFLSRRQSKVLRVPQGPRGAKGDAGANVMAIALFVAASGLSIPLGTDAVRTSGYSTKGVGIADYVNDAAVDAAYVAAHPRTSFVSANGRGFRLDDRHGRKVEQLGAIGDGTTDDADALIAAHALDGFVLYGDATYLSSKPIPYVPNQSPIGGRGKTRVKFTNIGSAGATNGDTVRSGSGFYGLSPINSSTPVNVNFAGIWVENDNSSNVGAGFYDTGGSYVNFTDCRITGFKYGLIWDQSEASHADRCVFESQTFGGAWIVNGPDLDPTAAGGYGNQLTISRSQFNEPAGAYGVLDDGGMNHELRSNNYNGCLNHIRAAGVTNLTISGANEFESAAGPPIVLSSLTAGGRGVGGNIVKLGGGTLAAAAAQPSIHCENGCGTLAFENVEFTGGAGTATAIITGASNLFALWIGIWSNGTIGTIPLFDARPQHVYDTTKLGQGVPATAPGTGFLTADQLALEAFASSTADGDVVTVAIDHGTAGGQVYLQSLVHTATSYSEFIGRTRHADGMAERFRFNETGLLLPAGEALFINSLKVVGARKTGWALDTGTAKRTANATYSGTAGAAYSQATLQTLMDAVRDLSQTVKALKDDLHSAAGHGLIGA